MLTVVARWTARLLPNTNLQLFMKVNKVSTFNKFMTTRSSTERYNRLHKKISQGCIDNPLSSVRNIQTSRPRYVNPVVMAVLRPISKFLAILVGRGFRKWWQSLPKSKRQIFLQHIRRNRVRYFMGIGVTASAGYYYYDSHVNTTLFTGRRRFTVFTSDQLNIVAKALYKEEMETYRDLILPNNHPYTLQVGRVGNRILQANNSIPQLYTKAWTVAVIDDPTVNCFVLPSGDIIMFRGMMDLLENDDQVAAVLSHEMSHAILEHAGETLSHGYLLDMLILLPLAFIWAFIPSNGIAVITHWFLNHVVTILLKLPYSRTLESEADTVGLHLAAKACYDVREASAFWGKMSLEERQIKPKEDKVIESPMWLSTHPSNEDRQQMLDAQMDKALKLRDTNNCPKLIGPDPRLFVKIARLHAEAAAKDHPTPLTSLKMKTSIIDNK